MDKEYIRKMAIQQLESLMVLAGDSIRGTDLELQLKMAVLSLENNNTRINNNNNDYYEDNVIIDEDLNNDDEVEELEVPNGFNNEQEYQDFLETQAHVLPTIVDEETGEEITLRPDDTVGTFEDNDGNIVETGNMDESLNKIHEIIEEMNTIRDEETGDVLYQNEVEEVPYIRVSFTRNDGRTLTEENIVNTIMDSPVSQTMLRTFGENYRIIDGDNDSQKIALFMIDNDNETAKKTSQGLMYSDGMMQFNGTSVFPGLGMVTAKTVL